MMNKKFRMTRLFENRIFLMVFSIVCAVILWFVININYGQEETRTIADVPINFDTTALKERYNLNLIEISSPTSIRDGKLNVSITAKRGVLNRITADDFTVTALTGGVTDAGLDFITLKYEKRRTILDFEFSAGNISTIYVRFDRIKSKEFDISSTTIDGTIKPIGDYVVGQPYSNIDNLILTGPEADIDRIDKVVVQATANETISETTTYQGVLIYYDKYGKIVSSEYITHDFAEPISVTIPVTLSKKLKLKVDLQNVTDYYKEKMLPYKISPETVTVEGLPKSMESVFGSSDEYVVSTIDFSTLTKEKNVIKVPLTFTNGIKEATEKVTEISISFDFSGIDAKTLSISTVGAVTFINGNSKQNAKVTAETINNVLVYGPAAKLKALNENDFVIVIDIGDRESFTGNYMATASIALKSADNKMCWVVGKYEVQVNIS
jgi:YbbR domain-containing protein